MTTMPESMDAGVQPLDAILTELGISNHTLVANAPVGLTHKKVQNARRGRRLTRRMQRRIQETLSKAAPDHTYRLEDLFTYRGR